MRTTRALLWMLAASGCQAPAAAPMDLASPLGTFIAGDPQRPGDPAAGYTALVDNGYIGCGIPWSVYSQYSTVVTGGMSTETLPGRSGHNAQLPYWLTATTVASGVEVVSANCLTCHAGHINGQLVVGLGAADRDFTSDPSTDAEVATQLTSDPKETAEITKWADRVSTIGPYTTTLTIGVNPADNLAAVLFAHRDAETLAWSDTPLLDLPPKVVVPVDVPPWWRMKKKNAMFYDAGGRGDHARIMMTASTLCTDTVADAQAIDAYFNDVRAYVYSLTPPAYPFPVDGALAARGQTVFEATCAECHGTYGAAGAYPNLLIATEQIGTDSALATGGSQFAQRFVDGFNQSFYGQTAHLDPQPGYMAPPLDGIWATAPYLHNGSVPTVEALLDSPSRPKYWTRSFASTDYDQAALGWTFTALDHGQDAEPSAQVKVTIYDTTLAGYTNGGHTYGDGLAPADRAAVLEYLKTL
jgi:cytochrome c5